MVLAVMINENQHEDETENYGELEDDQSTISSIFGCRTWDFHLEDKVFVWKESNDTTQRLGQHYQLISNYLFKLGSSYLYLKLGYLLVSYKLG